MLSVLAYLLSMQEASDLRGILSQNIKKARAKLHITQVKLAIYSDISVAHMVEIEQCKTWVSEKTLANIAHALNMEAYELLIPEKGGKNEKNGQETKFLQQTADLIKGKKNQLRKISGDLLDDLILDITKLYSER